jgi:glycosyltransferase involved in cell wall biosynthesis
VTKPLFSIITATLNRASYLRQAIESVVAQGRDDVEHLIIDGGSTDGTLEMLKEWPQLRVYSGKDAGIYDAFNKGLALATGEIVHFLNSDDLLVPGALDSVAKAFTDPSIEIVSGGVEFFEDSPSSEEKLLRRETAPSALEFSVQQVVGGLPVLNARFPRRELAERIGKFDLGYAIASDREYLVRLALLRPRGVVVPEVVYRYRIHAGSLTLHETERDTHRVQAEHVRLAEQHLSSPQLDPSARAALRALLVRESAALAIDRLIAGDRPAALDWARRGCRGAAWWPVIAAKRMAGRLLGRSSRSTLARS